ncbi:dihydrofolate reductase family protein [Streptomyces sp. XD-27]|uniref:dihydrofolate reductase family protein n=1 Tax=Streptomyces sp. XD-27 TaxID=3062779 RepID=UPI0026F4130F|nr:dihydrofolate reductase family protein [Streptomyces sp. XD-27]WKX69313.1 dihydrofolate reductase family protein [Streptomyces sp. XD-27]
MAAPDTAPGAPVKRTEPLVPLYEHPGLPRWGLPPALAALYGGDLGFTEPCLYANFVASLDGVVALGPEFPSSGSTISAREPADRFLMGLLRACADAVLIGAGTLRASPHHRWTPEHVYPPAAADYARLRLRRSRPPEPELVVVTASGALPTDHPALRAGALIVTTTAGADRLAGRLPTSCAVVPLGDGPVLRLASVVDAILARGHTAVLSEAGPLVLGQLVGDGLLDELFLTVSPVLAGRAGTIRHGLIAGLELLPNRREGADLISARRRGSYLFLRYRLRALLGRD